MCHINEKHAVQYCQWLPLLINVHLSSPKLFLVLYCIHIHIIFCLVPNPIFVKHLLITFLINFYYLVRTGLEGPGLTVPQKIWYCLATVGGQYIWARLQSFSAFRRWGDSEQVLLFILSSKNGKTEILRN